MTTSPLPATPMGHPPVVAVVGATGQVGSLMRHILLERRFPMAKLRLLASARSAGRELVVGNKLIIVEDAHTADLAGIDLALFSAGGDASRALAPRYVEAGAVVIDNSAAWRSSPEIPLVVAGVNDDALTMLDGRAGIIANPNCTTMVAMMALAPLHHAAGLGRLTVSTYQACSGAGLAGVDELKSQLRRTVQSGDLGSLTYGSGPTTAIRSEVFPAVVAHNVVPEAGHWLQDGSGDTSEERKFADESTKILSIPDLDVTCTCVRVPVFTGHSLAITAEFTDDISPERAEELLEPVPGVRVVNVPMPLAAAGLDEVLVGRIRQAPGRPRRLSLFVSGDNLRKGAALNAVQLAEVVVAGGTLPR